ncbi:MAG: M1 family aminopeptidase [Planctomycetota bacterium]
MLRLLVVLSVIALASPVLGFEHVEVCRYCQGLHRALDHAAPGDSSGGPKPRQYAPDRLVDVLRIAIDVTPDFDKRTVEGETTLTFAPISKPVEQLKLNATRLAVASVTGSVEVADFVATDEDLTLLFARPIAVGEQASVTIRYSAEPKQGLYFRTEAMGYPAGDDHIWTQGETHEAPSWFPCFDYPNERSSTEVTCRVPPAMTVLSNGRMVSEAIDPETGLKAVHWVQEKPHVSYLVCLVAGHLHKLEKSHGGLKLRFFTQPSLAEYAANSFADTDQIIGFFEREIGLPFPWEKYDQVTIHDFNSGGMENTTLTTLTNRTLFADDTESIYSSRGLDAHETAHQWFGDLVTCEDWSHLWLNEGFATYYTHLYKGHRLGHDEMLYGLYRDASGRVLNRSADTRPIVYRGYKDAWEQFDFRAYPKGSWVLHMLRSQLGEKVYRRAIKRYLKKHELTSVVTPDLMAELEDASGLSLDRFFDQWVYHGGVPTLKVTYKWLPNEKLAHVRVEQTQKVSDEVLRFHLPTKVRFHIGGDAIDHAIEITGAAHDFYVPLPGQPEVVRFDPEYTLLANLTFDKPQPMLEKQLKMEGDMMGRLLAAKSLGKKENKKAVAALTAALTGDPFYGVRIAASKSLGAMQTDEAFEALAASLTQADARVRRQVVTDLGRYYKPEALDHLLKVAADEPNPAVAGAAVNALGKHNDPRVVDYLVTALKVDTLKDEVALAAIKAIEGLQEESLKGPLLQTLAERRIDFGGRRYAGLLKSVASLWREAEDKSPAIDLLHASLNDPARRVRQAAVVALGELGDRRSLALLTDLAESGNDRVAADAKAAIEKIDAESPRSPRELKELRKLVRDLQQEQAKLKKTVDDLKAKQAAAKSS